ncbi:hypothetical protein [Phyllobacterium ifriqiyense]
MDAVDVAFALRLASAGPESRLCMQILDRLMRLSWTGERFLPFHVA